MQPDAQFMKGKLPMKNLILPSAVALLAGVNASFAADEKKPGEELRAAQPPQIAAPEYAVRLPEAKELTAEEARRIEAVGTKVFGVKWGEKPTAVSARGFQVFTDGVTTLSYRPTGNAYFLKKKGKAYPSGNGAFEGSNEQLIARGKAILAQLGVDSSEIAETQVLQQFVTAGSIDPTTRQAKIETPLKDRRNLLVTRVIRNLPVWSSRLNLDLDAEGGIASLELSWPAIEPKVREAAIGLKKIVDADYKAPERQGARIESTQAGILHSPAASFIDEQVAAIRVIYASADPRFGKKPVLYLGADGKPVAMPRQLESKAEPPLPARPSKADQTPR
jgi:hypothetical protein